MIIVFIQKKQFKIKCRQTAAQGPNVARQEKYIMQKKQAKAILQQEQQKCSFFRF